MKLVEVGTKWWGGSDKTFEVVDVNAQDDNIWVHYKNIITDQQYSCFIEAFLNRFNEVPK